MRAVFQADDGTVYNLPDKSTYYVQAGDVGDSQRRFYGPYRGNTLESLDLPRRGIAAAQQIETMIQLDQATQAASPSDSF